MNSDSIFKINREQKCAHADEYVCVCALNFNPTHTYDKTLIHHTRKPNHLASKVEWLWLQKKKIIHSMHLSNKSASASQPTEKTANPCQPPSGSLWKMTNYTWRQNRVRERSNAFTTTQTCCWHRARNEAN